MSDYPRIKTMGISGVLITFGEKMSEPANRASLAFRSVIENEDWPQVTESTMSLVSVFLVIDLVDHAPEPVIERLEELLSSRDWYAAPLPEGRTLWHVPTVFGTDLAPQLEEAAEVAGIDPQEAIRQISTSRVRVLTIGFAPGQPYLGELPDAWNIPRQQALTKSVPAGALVIAIRQLVLFTGPTPTGWRHIGQTAFANFRPDAEKPFALSPGDELIFPAISAAELRGIRARDTTGDGGATREVLR